MLKRLLPVFALLFLMAAPLGATTTPIEISSGFISGRTVDDLAFTLRTNDGTFSLIGGAKRFPIQHNSDQLTAGFLSESISAFAVGNQFFEAGGAMMQLDLAFEPITSITGFNLFDPPGFPGTSQTSPFTMTGVLTFTDSGIQQSFYGQGNLTAGLYARDTNVFGHYFVNANFVFVPEPPAIVLIGLSLAALSVLGIAAQYGHRS